MVEKKHIPIRISHYFAEYNIKIKHQTSNQMEEMATLQGGNVLVNVADVLSPRRRGFKIDKQNDFFFHLFSF